MEIVYLDTVDGPDNILTTLHKVGRIAPMHATSAGKVLLLNYTPQMLQKFIETRGLAALTPNTIISPEDLVTTLQHIREDGFAIDDEEYEQGIRSVAAPVYDYENKITAAISVSGPTNRMNYQKINHIKKYVIESAQEISKVLGHIPAGTT